MDNLELEKLKTQTLIKRYNMKHDSKGRFATGSGGSSSSGVTTDDLKGFTLKSSKSDPVKTYVSEDGFYKITKKPSDSKWTLKKVSLFNTMGEKMGEFDTLKEAIKYANS